MYNHHITDMINLIFSDAGHDDLDEKLRDSIAVKFNQYWEDKVAVTWTTEDVIDRAAMSEKTLTEEQAQEILQIVFKRHDASIGINWDVLDFYIGDYVSFEEVLGSSDS